MSDFLHDVLHGLSQSPKQLSCKYFYDDAGDELFRQIMLCDEYYLTRCEMEIFTSQAKPMANFITSVLGDFDVVELGAGDASKSIHLLKELASSTSLTYLPIDISASVITHLNSFIPQQMPGVSVTGLHGDYFSMLAHAQTLSNKPKLVLFLGSNIGNFLPGETIEFFKAIRAHLQPPDMLLVGFDLQKEPQIIVNAYSDKAGITARFNLNLLQRINKELNGNFEIGQFKHFATYDPQAGSTKSYLVSMCEQEVALAGKRFHFRAYEAIFMEVAQKYTLPEIERFAKNSGFKILRQYYDTRHWFVDSLFQCI